MSYPFVYTLTRSSLSLHSCPLLSVSVSPKSMEPQVMAPESHDLSSKLQPQSLNTPAVSAPWPLQWLPNQQNSRKSADHSSQISITAHHAGGTGGNFGCHGSTGCTRSRCPRHAPDPPGARSCSTRRHRPVAPTDNSSSPGAPGRTRRHR